MLQQSPEPMRRRRVIRKDVSGTGPYPSPDGSGLGGGCRTGTASVAGHEKDATRRYALVHQQTCDCREGAAGKAGTFVDHDECVTALQQPAHRRRLDKHAPLERKAERSQGEGERRLQGGRDDRSQTGAYAAQADHAHACAPHVEPLSRTYVGFRKKAVVGVSLRSFEGHDDRRSVRERRRSLRRKRPLPRPDHSPSRFDQPGHPRLVQAVEPVADARIKAAVSQSLGQAAGFDVQVDEGGMTGKAGRHGAKSLAPRPQAVEHHGCGDRLDVVAVDNHRDGSGGA
jgi:hypothetical protein